MNSIFYSQVINRLSKLSFHSTVSNLRNPGITHPYRVSWSWKHPDIEEYTTDPLKYVKTGGRGPDGRIVYKHISGGLKRPFYQVDYLYAKKQNESDFHEEKIITIFKNWWRHPFLALVANSTTKRWIIATKGMKEGDIFRTNFAIEKIPVKPIEGNAYPIGALAKGTKICLVEMMPGEGAMLSRSAGTSCTILDRGINIGDAMTDDLEDPRNQVTVYEQNRRVEFNLNPRCMCIVGQVSNENLKDFKYENFNEKKMYGHKQRSGYYQKKTGRFGAKIKRKTLSHNPYNDSPIKSLIFEMSDKQIPVMDSEDRQIKLGIVQKREIVHKKATPMPFNQGSAKEGNKFEY